MALNTDGNRTWLETVVAPDIYKPIKDALEAGEYTFIDFTTIPTKTGGAVNVPKLVLVVALLGVGLALVMRRK